jgi:hypothetical protein
LAVPAKLLFDVHHTGGDINVTPAQANRFADAQPGVRHALEHRTKGSGVLEESHQLAIVKHRRRPASAGGSFVTFQPAYWVVVDPALPFRKPTDLPRDPERSRRGARTQRRLIRS